MKKRNSIISWILRILIALGFLGASLGKLTNSQKEMFENWGFPDGFHYIIGIIELLLVVLVLIPRTLKIGLIGMSIILIGALLTHLINDPIGQTIRPIIFFALISVIYFLNFSKGLKN